MSHTAVAICTLAILGVATAVRADSQTPPEAHEVWSPSRQFVVTVEPNADGGYSIAASVATAFRIHFDGRREQTWSMPIYFYSGEGYLSDDGETLVVVRTWPFRHQPFENIKGVLLYRRGVEFASHRIVDMVANYREMQCSVSHIDWWRSARWDKQDRAVLVLTAIDGTSHRLSLKNGVILSTTWPAPLPTKRCDAELDAECIDWESCHFQNRRNPRAPVAR